MLGGSNVLELETTRKKPLISSPAPKPNQRPGRKESLGALQRLVLTNREGRGSSFWGVLHWN